MPQCVSSTAPKHPPHARYLVLAFFLLSVKHYLHPVAVVALPNAASSTSLIQSSRTYTSPCSSLLLLLASLCSQAWLPRLVLQLWSCPPEGMLRVRRAVCLGEVEPHSEQAKELAGTRPGSTCTLWDHGFLDTPGRVAFLRHLRPTSSLKRSVIMHLGQIPGIKEINVFHEVIMIGICPLRTDCRPCGDGGKSASPTGHGVQALGVHRGPSGKWGPYGKQSAAKRTSDSERK